MTKEEIVRQEYEKMFGTQKYDTSVNRKTNFKYFSPAMDEYAKQQVVYFQKWTNQHGWFWNPNQWLNYHGEHTPMTTEELYSLFTTNI